LTSACPLPRRTRSGLRFFSSTPCEITLDPRRSLSLWTEIFFFARYTFPPLSTVWRPYDSLLFPPSFPSLPDGIRLSEIWAGPPPLWVGRLVARPVVQGPAPRHFHFASRNRSGHRLIVFLA